MSVIFNLDGTETHISEVFDLQEDLASKIELHKSHLNSGLEELRTYRDDELVTSDWTQVPDGPLDSTTKAAWATYREKLRDLPGDAKAPYWFEKADWPLAPGQSEINPEALGFIKSNDDPLGIATTSWVGVTTAMVDKGNFSISDSPGIGTDIIGVGNTMGLEVGDHIKNESVIGIIAGITTVSISLASTISSGITTSNGFDYSRSEEIYYAQDRPELTYAVTASSSTAVIGSGVSFTVTLTNQGSEQDVEWQTSGPLLSTGTLTIIPVGTTGIGTVSLTIPSVDDPDILEFIISRVAVGASVGVTTT
tara:strand:+ start:3599 stop:4522 length:924 start_codon:yes stop_codon:yes gene_type:complete